MEKILDPCFFIAYSEQEFKEIEEQDYPFESCTRQQDFCVRIQMYSIPLEGTTFQELEYQTRIDEGEKVYGVFRVVTVEPNMLLAVSMQSDFAFNRFQKFAEPQPNYPQGYCKLLGYYAYRDDIAVERVQE